MGSWGLAGIEAQSGVGCIDMVERDGVGGATTDEGSGRGPLGEATGLRSSPMYDPTGVLRNTQNHESFSPSEEPCSV